jgi:hypothetical protein
MAAFNSTLTSEAPDGSAAQAARQPWHRPQVADLPPDQAAEVRRRVANLDTAFELAAAGLAVFPAVVVPQGDSRWLAHDLMDGDDQHNRQQQAAGCSRDPQPEFRRTNGYVYHAENGHAFTDGLDPTQVMLGLYRDTAVGLNGLCVLTSIDVHTGMVLPQRFAIGDVEGMAAEAVARAEVANVYFAPAVIKKSLPAGARGMLGDIVAVLGVVVDDDGDTGKRAILPPGIEPTLEVTTCEVPVTNRHIHFVFTRPLLPAAAKDLAELLHRKCGGDYGTADIDHIWRLAGTKNHPNKKKITERRRPPEPQDVKLTGGSFQRIDPDALKRALEPMPDAHPSRASRATNGDARGSYRGGSTDRSEIIARLPGWVIDLVETEVVEGEGDRSAHSFHTMLVLMEHGLTDNEVRLVANGAPFAAKFRERGDLDEEIGRVPAKWDGEVRRHRAHAKTVDRHPNTNAPIDGAALLDQVHAFIGRFVAYPSEYAHDAHTLWVAHTHAMDAWESTPRLAALSEEPASGKTRVLEVTEPLVPRPVEAVNVSPAYLFRKVGAEEGRPTILYDEIDTVFGPKAKANEEIRGLLNAGHRKGAVAGRCVVIGKQVKTEEIPAYCAVALAGLRDLPDTIMTRAVVLRMRRRAPDEQVEAWRRRIHAQEGKEIRDQLALWAEGALGSVINTWPEMPKGVTDRECRCVGGPDRRRRRGWWHLA